MHCQSQSREEILKCVIKILKEYNLCDKVLPEDDCIAACGDSLHLIEFLSRVADYFAIGMPYSDLIFQKQLSFEQLVESIIPLIRQEG